MSAAVKPEKKVQSSEGLLTLLRERYPSESHVTLCEVRDAAGFAASRSCDALSLGTWPSRGLLLRGFEVKVTRSDWLREYRDPSKAESFSPYCDEWYLVASDKSVVQDDELPATWGLLVARGSRLECVKAAVVNPTPDLIDRGLLVAMLKRAKEQGPTQKALDAARDAGREQGKAEVARRQMDLDELRSNNQRLEKAIADFERASGVRIADRWTHHDAEKIGDAVRVVMGGGDKHVRDRCRHLLSEVRGMVSTLERLAAEPATRTPEKAAVEVAVSPSDTGEAP